MSTVPLGPWGHWNSSSRRGCTESRRVSAGLPLLSRHRPSPSLFLAPCPVPSLSPSPALGLCRWRLHQSLCSLWRRSCALCSAPKSSLTSCLSPPPSDHVSCLCSLTGYIWKGKVNMRQEVKSELKPHVYTSSLYQRKYINTKILENGKKLIS